MPTILLAEDNPITRKLVRFTLQTAQFVVREAVNGEEALRVFQTHEVDLVLLDLMLPDMDGFEVLARLRQLPNAAETPVLAFTGLLAAEVEARVSAAGFDDLITKPVEPSRLIQLVRAHLPATEPATLRGDRTRRLLVADDDAVQRKLVTIRLQRAGYDVTAVADGQEALERARQIRPDAIVSDVLMPRLDGFGLCVAVRNDPGISATPVLLITNSYLANEDRDLARRAGASDLLVRTPELREVLGALETVLASSHVALGPVTLDPEVERERVRRVMNQLERQVALNAGSSQRSALLAAELSVLSGISEAVATRHDIDGALRQVLAACFDAGGISIGALYLLEGETWRVLSFGALDGWTAADLENFFGERALLESAIRDQVLLVAPSSAARSVAQRARLRSLLAVPLSHNGAPLGALVMMSRTTDLNEDHVSFARAVAGQISLAIAVTRAFDEKDASERVARSQATVLKSILESMADGVLVANESGDITHWNPAADAIMPMAPSRDDSWVGRGVFRPDKTTLVPLDDFPLTRAMRGESVDRDELFVRHGDLSDGAWFSVNARPLRDESGVARGAVAVFRDVTVEKTTSAQLLVSDRMASLGTLAAGVAHEINSPLTVVLANLEMLSTALGDVVDGDAGDMLRDARDAAERVRNIVRDLKLFSRVDEHVRGAVDIERVLESSIRMVTNEIRHRARLVRSCSPVPPVYANESRLGQVFLNMLVNAVQALPEGRADQNEIRVSTSTTADNRVRIAISDTGAGMPPEIVARIFAPFFTTKPIGVGTGLGLAICHQLVSAVGGEIHVDTAVGRGTTFFVTLPPMIEEVPVRITTQRIATVPSRRARVLVIDDDLLITVTIKRALGAEHDVVVSVSPLVDGVVGALVDGSRSRSGARLGVTGMGIGYQRVIA